ncbi:MAG: hypothetical protein ACI4DN_07685, partial [Lachnospiraceae bacterium]
IRYVKWNQILEECKARGLLAQWLGTGLSAGVYEESLYIRLFYTLGYVGILLSFLLVVQLIRCMVMVRDRKTFYLMIILLVLLLGSGVAINSMGTVQMSWFLLLFAGMVVSSAGEEASAGEGN